MVFNSLINSHDRTFRKVLLTTCLLCFYSFCSSQTMNKSTQKLFNIIVSNQNWERPTINDNKARKIYGSVIKSNGATALAMNDPKSYEYGIVTKQAKSKILDLFKEHEQKIWEEVKKQYPQIETLKPKQHMALQSNIKWKVRNIQFADYELMVDSTLNDIYEFFKSYSYFRKYGYSYEEYLNVEEKKRTVGVVPISEAVDLGLSVKWAPYNVGGQKAYYAWGETLMNKESFHINTYKFYSCHWKTINDGWSTRDVCEVNKITKYCTDKKEGYTDNKLTLDPEDDAAHVEWGATWRMPTAEEFQELASRCEWQWTSQRMGRDLVSGFEITGPNGNSIFLPAYGIRDGGSTINYEIECGYWTSSLHESNSYWAYCLDMMDDKTINNHTWIYRLRKVGRCIRPVCPK